MIERGDNLAIAFTAVAQQFFARTVTEEVEPAEDEVLRRLRELEDAVRR